MIKKLPNLTAAVLASSIFSLSLPSNAQAGVLGSINMARACQQQSSTYLFDAILVGNNPNAYSWRCRSYALTWYRGWPSWDASIDMTQACRSQYNNGRAFAETTNLQSPYSWRCRVN